MSGVLLGIWITFVIGLPLADVLVWAYERITA